jgi:predicted enzyme related to lactoylglutathione lyase
MTERQMREHHVQKTAAAMNEGDVVHLELHTPDLAAAADFYRALFRWRAAPAPAAAYPYLSVDAGLSTGLVGCGTQQAVWIPFMHVDDVDQMTASAIELGAEQMLAPRSGPFGRRSVVHSNLAGDIAFWEHW